MQQIDAHHDVTALAIVSARAATRALTAARLARDAATELGEHVVEGEDLAEKLRAAVGELENAAEAAEGLRARLID